MDLKKLDEPFSESDIEWRAQSCGEKNAKFWIMCLAYVTNRAIMRRLDDVCGKECWRNEYRDIPNNGGVECGISIKINGEWVTKWDAAENTQVEAVKGGRSGAMKRAAVQWGIGRYLYELESNFGIVSESGKFSAQTKEKKWFKWDPPKLPLWAIPTKKLTPHQINELQEAITGKGYTIQSVCKQRNISALSDILDSDFTSVIQSVQSWPQRPQQALNQ